CFLLNHDRPFTSCDEMGLKRRASYPLLNAEAFQLANIKETRHQREALKDPLILMTPLSVASQQPAPECAMGFLLEQKNGP
ncbi:hypothetical protein GOODEAATRI_018163, partial [Goodea atripinnis]